MKKFVVIYHAPKEAMEMMANVTPEEAKRVWSPGWLGQASVAAVWLIWGRL